MIFNVDTRRYLAQNPRFALRSWERLRGMIGRDFKNAPFDAMVFPRCGSVHTFFMTARIDVVFLDYDLIVCGLFSAAAPWRPLLRARGAKTAIELPCGTILENGCEIGHRINLNANLTTEALEELVHAASSAVLGGNGIIEE